jgi:threonine synthase
MWKRFDLRCDGCGYVLGEDKLNWCSLPVAEKGFSGHCPSCDRALLNARYCLDLNQFAHWKTQLAQRSASLWRYQELLPISDWENAVTLGEGWTPLIALPRFGDTIGLEKVYIKDERQGPTATFKDRQATVAISFLKEQGIQDIVLASTGNVAIAYSAYAARAGMQVYAFFPDGVAEAKIKEASLYGAHVMAVGGTYDEAKAAAAQFASEQGMFLDQGIKTFAGVESMKTMGFEMAEQLGWRSPDWYVQGVSGGMGPVGVAKGFAELQTLGLVEKMPALGLIQSSGCAPIVNSLQRGEKTVSPVASPQSAIATLATGNPGLAYNVLKDHLDTYGGSGATATDQEAAAMTQTLARTEGILVEPATAVTFVGVAKLAQQGIIQPQETVVINCSGREKDVMAVTRNW